MVAASITSLSMEPKREERILILKRRHIAIMRRPKKKDTRKNCPAALSALSLSFLPRYWDTTMPPPPLRAERTKMKRKAS